MPRPMPHAGHRERREGVRAHPPRGAPELERILVDPTQSFRWSRHDFPSELARWNYHPQLELHLIASSSGVEFVGDHIGPFEPGNIVLVGPNLPHHWESERAPGEVVIGRDVVLQFEAGLLERAAAVLPEVYDALPLLQAAARGLEFRGETARRAAAHLLRMGETHGLERLVLFLDLVRVLARSPEKQPLASVGWSPILDPEASRVVHRTMSYVFEGLSGPRSMAEAARLAGMSPTAFSRFFKRHTGNNFVEYVRKLRVAAACKLLAETELPVTQVCFEAGYRNLSNFNRHFREEKGLTPTKYRRLSRRAGNARG